MAYSDLEMLPGSNAAFAVISRLLSCLVTESLLRAVYLPLTVKEYRDVQGLLVVLSPSLSGAESLRISSRNPCLGDIFVVVPLRQEPVLSPASKNVAADASGRLVALVDPLDMLPEVYDLIDDKCAVASERDWLSRHLPWNLRGIRAQKIAAPQALWRKYVQAIGMDEAMAKSIEKELDSSFYWQRLSFNDPARCPLLSSPSIEWEQSLVAGHPTHPMHRARSAPFNMPPQYDWYRPNIRFVRVPRKDLDILGTFEEESRHLATLAASRAGRHIPEDDASILMPVHELQIPVIISKFKGVQILDEGISIPALAQASLRTVIIPELPGKALKLSVGIKVSSSLRTISHFTANFGPRFSQEIVPKLAIDPNVLTIETEPASAVYRAGDPDVAKHFTAIFRDEFEPIQGQNLIVCAALLEAGHANVRKGISAVEHVFGLDTEAKREEFLDRYIRLACEALLPPLIYNGVAFEAHAQNVLVRFDIKTKQILGFVVRDLGGLRIHPPTLASSTGVDFDFLDGHCVVTKSAKEGYPKFYHTLVHNHLQRLIRVLGMHYNGRGWEMLRRHLEKLIPLDHELRKAWLSPESAVVDGKCLMRMRMQGVYRDMVYSPFPNLIQYRPRVERPAEKTTSVVKFLFSLVALSFLLVVVV